MKNLSVSFALSLCLLAAVTLPAQTGSSPFDPTIASLQFESVVPLGSITGADVLFHGAPESVLAALQSGQLEIHESTIYDPDVNTLKSVLFLVPGGTPIPAPVQPADDSDNVLGAFTMRVDAIYWNSYESGLTAAMIGRVSKTPDRFKSLLPLGSTYVLSFSAPTSSPAQVARVIGMFPGVVSYSVPVTTGNIPITVPSTAPVSGPTLAGRFQLRWPSLR
jgi:hypothetical protein